MSKINFPVGAGGGGGGSDYGGLTGLGDDDHTQSLLRTDFATSGAQEGYGLFTQASGIQLSDHGQLGGLTDNDHPQYLLTSDFNTSGDARYFREDEHVSVFTGPTDDGKPVVLNSDGKIDAALLQSGIGGGTTVISTPTAITSFVEASTKNSK